MYYSISYPMGGILGPAERTPYKIVTILFLILFTVVYSQSLQAGLTDETQTTQHVPGSGIAKSLEEQVGAGHGDAHTPDSSVYLINRDPARAIRRGRQLFQRKFTVDQGLGPRVNTDSTGNIRETRELGAGLMVSCAGCHGRPRGAAGFGGDVVTRPDSLDAPHLFGLGLQEMIGDEMTQDLRGQFDNAVELAVSGCESVQVIAGFGREDRQRQRHGQRQRQKQQQGQAQGRTKDLLRYDRDRATPSMDCQSDGRVVAHLASKGISSGKLSVSPDGIVDRSGIEGIDPDLRVRPFFHQGGTISMREFIVGAFNAEMGLEAPDEILCAVTDPVAPERRTSPTGFVFDPELDVFERPPVCDQELDGDGDLVANEVDTALVDFMEMYLLNYFKPGLGKQNKRTRTGQVMMEQVGCTSCHTRNIEIQSDRRVADVETRYDPTQGMFNRLFATASTRFTVVEDGDAYPLLVPDQEVFVVENVYTDFKRHDLGEAFHEREYDGTFQTDFLTEALWGVGTTAPYGHDGRSINLEEVILRHCGEAEATIDNFRALSANDQRKIIEFLGTLVLFPPDDTASNLNSGNPEGHPQLPENHGSINLGELFQINPDERE